MESELNSKIMKRDSGLLEDGLELSIKRLRKSLDEKKKALSDKQNRAKHMRECRARQRNDILVLKSQTPGVAVSFRSGPGRPSLEQDHPGLLETIASVAMHGGSASDKRRSETLRPCKTLADMGEVLREMGYKISNSGLYLRLVPHRSSSVEGRRHVTTVPVKLCRAQADLHRDHVDQRFCKATINGLEQIASILGPEQVKFCNKNK